MQNVSEDFKTAISEPSRELKSRITLPGLTLDDDQIQLINLDSSLVFGEDFEIGTAPMDTVKIELIFSPEGYIEYDYEDKECDAQIGIKLYDDTVEYLSIGLFTVEEVIKNDYKITLNCVDRMYKAEKEFVNNLMFPTTILDILQSACEQSNITLATTNFANANYVIPNEPVFENITCRTIFAQVAELAGGYAVINRQGELEILTLGNASVKDLTKDHYIDFKRDEVAIGKIDKVIVKVGEERAEQGIGGNIYTIVDNMFVQDPADVIGPVFNVLKNINYSACKFKWQGDFSLDLGDKITIDGYETYALDRKLSYTGGLGEEYKAPAKSNVERNSTGKSNIILDINNIKTQIKVIEGEITQTIEKVENLVADAANRLYQSQTEIPFDLNVGTGSIQLFRDSIIPYYKVTSDTNIDLSASFPNSQFAENLAGEEVTISIDVLVDVDRIVTIDGSQFDVKGNRWTRIYVTKVLQINTTKNVRARNPYSRNITRDKINNTNLIDGLSTDINIIYYRNLQVQKGNVATRWTQTPEELESTVNRMTTEIKQLQDSISLVAIRNENTGKFEITPKSIVQAIDSTDGVGRLKTVKVTVDENGLTVDDGALIIRDRNNTAIVTSDGLRVVYIFTSSGEFSGWQQVGILNRYTDLTRRMATMNVYVPSDIIIDKAELHTKSMPSYWTGHDNVPNGFYHARNLKLYEGDASDGVLDWPYSSSYDVTFGRSGRTDITSNTWGGNWTPTGEGIKTKTADVKGYIYPGQSTVFIVDTADSVSEANSRYMGAIQMDLIITGFLRG